MPLVRTITLYTEQELRLLTKDSKDVRVQLVEGLAEIYGAEMTLNKEYAFPANSSISVFSWAPPKKKSVLKVTGTPRSCQVFLKTRMILNVVLHAYLQERRVNAEKEGTKGPVILMVGPKNVGKTTLCRLLVNYAARMGKRPMYVDLDVGQNSISIPGSVGVLTVDKPVNIIQGYNSRDATVFHFGHTSPSDNLELYFLLIKHLGNVIKSGLRYANPNARSSGVIINTSGWISGHGYDAITYAAKCFEINSVMVLDEEEVFCKLERDMPAMCEQYVKVHYMPKLEWAIKRNDAVRSKLRDDRIGEYFYGLFNRLCPYEINMHFSEIKIFKVVAQPVNDDFDSTNATLRNMKLEPVALSLQLLDQVFALMKIDIDETITENLALAEVVGFVSVKRIFVATGLISFLSAQPRPLASNVLLFGDMKLLQVL